jgi:hypothetical protein
MTCLLCKHLRSGKLTRQGFNQCAIDKPWASYPDTHTCTKFVRTDEAQIARRLAWVGRV